MEALLRIEGVCKHFGGVVTADNINMEVLPGEIHGLIGPNGAGKTTLLNLISGIYKVDKGKIFLGDIEITNMSSHKRAKLGIGRTFQTPRFLTKASIRDNLQIGIDLSNPFGHISSFMGKRGASLENDTSSLLEIAGITIKWEEEISSLSFGQRKLLEIIRSMLSHPKIMLIDEPAAGLNDKEKENAIDLIRLAAKKRGTSVILIEHSMEMVMSICDNITVINFGKILGEGTPEIVSRNKAVIEAYLGRSKDAKN